MGWGCLEMGGYLLYLIFFGDFSWCSIEKKFWCVFLSFVNKHVLQNKCLKQMFLQKYEMIGINSTDMVVFLTVICLPHGQLWIIIKGAASFTQY